MNASYSTNLRYEGFASDEDSNTFHEILRRPSVCTHTSQSLIQPLSRRSTDKIKNALLESSLLFVVIYLEDQCHEPIGALFLKSASPDMVRHRCSEFGLDMGIEGEGYEVEAIRWALDWEFGTADLHRVECNVPGWNSEAREIYQDVGFQEEGRRRACFFKDDVWWDEVHFGILKEEWQQHKSESEAESEAESE